MLFPKKISCDKYDRLTLDDDEYSKSIPFPKEQIGAMKDIINGGAQIHDSNQFLEFMTWGLKASEDAIVVLSIDRICIIIEYIGDEWYAIFELSKNGEKYYLADQFDELTSYLENRMSLLEMGALDS